MSAPMLQGKNIQQWKAAHAELAKSFVWYAEHQAECKSQANHTHIHNLRVDSRITCDRQPCTCGLAQILESIMEVVPYIVPCPDTLKIVE